MLQRRAFLTGLGSAAIVLSTSDIANANFGSVNANTLGLIPDSPVDQGRLLQTMLENAAVKRQSVFVEPGTYRVSNVTLPSFVNLRGVEGATRFEYAGGDHFFYGENTDQTILEGISLDGAFRPTKGYAEAAVRITKAKKFVMRNCSVSNSGAIGVYALETGGALEGNNLRSCAGTSAIYAVDSTGFSIRNNLVEDCANGGILVHRQRRGEDNTIVSNNRVRRIGAINGGTGQWGNGINTFRADGVIVSNNHVSDCAFSAVRSNSCSNIQITNNTCIRVGETSIYSEFAFEGASIIGNVIDYAAIGISIANFNEGGRMSVCSNNIVRNIHNTIPYPNDGHIHGIGIAVEADTIVSGNVIDKTPRFGMLLGWGPYLRNVVVNANVVRDTETGIYLSVVDGIGEVSISDNIFSELKSHAIAGYHWHDRVSGDLASKGSDQFETVSIANNRVSG